MAVDRDEIHRKLAQLFIVGIPGTKLDGNSLHALMRMGVGGVILFKANYESPEQLIELTNALQKNVQTSSFENLPLWIGVDQEGGRVQRFKEPFTILPALETLGKINSPKTCFEAGFIVAQELRSVGVNLNFAPVIDVRQTEAPVIGDRSFSRDCQVVANLGSALIRGQQKGGVLSVAKHFPGHGGATVDSHEDLPKVEKTLAEFEELDWQPFRRAVRSRVEGVMTAHILCPNLDPGKPATLSKKILQDILRKDIRFNKLIFSDDMEMGAIAKHFSAKDSVMMAVEAGCDHLIFGHKLELAEEALDNLTTAFVDGALPMARLDESLERIRDAKRRLIMPYRPAKNEKAKEIISHPEFRKISEAIARGEAVDAGPSDMEIFS
jgi:beta-N-acetylhexosaminidase